MITPFIPCSRAHVISATVASRSCTVSIARAARRPGVSFAKSTSQRSYARLPAPRNSCSADSPNLPNGTPALGNSTSATTPSPSRTSVRSGEFHSPSRALPVSAANAAGALLGEQRTILFGRLGARFTRGGEHAHELVVLRAVRGLDVRDVVLGTPRGVSVARDDDRPLFLHGVPRCCGSSQGTPPAWICNVGEHGNPSGDDRA